MMQNNICNLNEQIALGAYILTPNARLAKVISENFNASQQQAVWQTPKVHPFSAFLTTLWQQAHFISQGHMPVLLNDAQESLLWQQALAELSHDMYACKDMANDMKKAWLHCKEWRLTIEEQDFSINDETLFFTKVVRHFLTLLDNQCPKAMMLEKLLPFIEQDNFNCPAHIILAYFDELTPMQQHFINVIETKKHTRISYFDDKISPKVLNRITLASKDSELEALITWLKTKTLNKKDQIAVVVPALAERRAVLKRKFEDHFKQDKFNISMGLPLRAQPIVNNALAFLKLNKKVIDAKELHLLLLNTYNQVESKEAFFYARVYNELIKSGEKRYYIDQVVEKLQGTQLAEQLSQFLAVDISGSHPFQHWQASFIELLSIMGFPGQHALDSEEYQAHTKLYEVLNHLNQFDIVHPEVNYNSALSILDDLLQATLFQAKAPEAPIQILGLIESLGLKFESIWVLGMTSVTLPQKASPSPFMPIALQKELNMPHASHEREEQFAKQSISRLRESADEVIFSDYQKDNDELFEPSPLITDLPLFELPIMAKERVLALESYQPNFHVPLAHNDNLTGGTFIIKEQSLCPFRAFAKFRLKLKETKALENSLDELDRGTLVHLVLEHFWNDVKSQSQLLSLDESALDDIIESNIAKAINQYKIKRRVTFNKQFIALEKKRLKTLLHRWLLIEKERAPFDIVNTEQSVTLKLDNISLNMKIDRLDRNEDDSLSVIDYKTGNPSVKSWFNERPEEPQLPLYCLSNEKITTLIFSQLSNKSFKNKGVSQAPVDIAGVKPIDKYSDLSWDEQREAWRKNLNALAKEFTEGEISPKPAKESLCLRCEFKSLCGKLQQA